MASSFGWLDHSEQQRRQMLEIVDLFREKGTLDELGIGSVRDAFADRFFPGTSTLHTRARYLLFIPWILGGLERRRVPSSRYDAFARWDQYRLVRALVAGGERGGVIGIAARQDIQRPPSAAYWGALRAYGIMRYPYSYESYVRSLDAHYRADRGALRSDDGELVEAAVQTWHGGLPEPPQDLFESTTFAFTRDEAEYVRERIVTQQRGTPLAVYLTSNAAVSDVQLPWTHQAVTDLDPQVRTDLGHAERFSLLTEGAYLLYNLMLAEAAVTAGMTRHESRPDRYRAALARWSADMTADAHLLAAWDVQEMWYAMAAFGRPIPYPTRHFIEGWVRLAVDGHARIADDAAARRLIEERERKLKRGLARLQTRRSLENWGGDSSLGRLTYRWPNARQFITDIKAGLRRTDTLDA